MHLAGESAMASKVWERPTRAARPTELPPRFDSWDVGQEYKVSDEESARYGLVEEKDPGWTWLGVLWIPNTKTKQKTNPTH